MGDRGKLKYGGGYIKFVVIICGEGAEAEVLYFPKGGKMSPRRGRECPPNCQKQTDNNNNNNNNRTKHPCIPLLVLAIGITQSSMSNV